MIKFFKIHRAISLHLTLCIITVIKLCSTANMHISFNFMYFQEQH